MNQPKIFKLECHCHWTRWFVETTVKKHDASWLWFPSWFRHPRDNLPNGFDGRVPPPKNDGEKLGAWKTAVAIVNFHQLETSKTSHSCLKKNGILGFPGGYFFIPFFRTTNKTRWWFQRFFMFTPILGEIIQFDEHIFQMGWFKPPTRKDDSSFFETLHFNFCLHGSIIFGKDLFN